MPSRPQTWCAALAAALLLLATTAEARFGKGGSRGRSSSGRGSGAQRGSSHGASAVGSKRSDSGSDTPRARPSRGPGRTRYSPAASGVVVAGGGGVAVAYRPYSPSEFFVEDPPEPEKLVRLGLEAQTARRGGGLGLHFALEEERVGVSTRLSTLSLRPAEDDGSERARLFLGGANLTFAAAVSHKGRLRLETGVAVTRVPGVTFVGPSLGMSFERCLLGELDLEGSAQWVPVPHLQLEGQMGLSLHLGPLLLRAGWRGLLLDDRGRINGVTLKQRVGGPYTGVGLAF
ncbi:hypothetical protein [Melittangium boletus]|uniref:hypothetical protein n=1 Tax=Melittangium boletus TaxID=83453 RepID=UPI003DA2BEBB